MSRRAAGPHRTASRLNARVLAAAIVVTSVVAAGAWSFSTWQRALEYPARALGGAASEVSLDVPRGAAFPTVLEALVDQGVVPRSEALWFRLYVLHKGAASKISAGAHVVRGTMSAQELLEELTRRPKARELRVTIPEGLHMLQVARVMADAGVGELADIEAAMRDVAWLRTQGIEAATVEGYLYPDTYRFRAGAPIKEALGRMIRRHRAVFHELANLHRVRLRELESKLGWTEHDVVTLASIVEKETAAVHERPIIAGVFLNRLTSPSFKPRLLQTDPTIIYGCTVPSERSQACQQWEGRIRRIHLRDPDNAYNTYTHEGLPPGPISNPGREAIEGVLQPKQTRFLYFVARNDGTHQFSATRAEHERYVDLYMRKGAVGDGSAVGSQEP